MLNRALLKARKKAKLDVRGHDLKHTFRRRLRAAGASFKDGQDSLGHKPARIKTHYLATEILNLWEVANKICEERCKPTLTVLRTVSASKGVVNVGSS